MGKRTLPGNWSGQFELDFAANPQMPAVWKIWTEPTEKSVEKPELPLIAKSVSEPSTQTVAEAVRSNFDAAIERAMETPEKVTELSRLLESDHKAHKWLFGMAVPVMRKIVALRSHGMSYEWILRSLRWNRYLDEEVFNFLKWGSATRSGEFLYKVVGCDPSAHGPYGQSLIVAILNRKRAEAEISNVGRDIEAIIDACGVEALRLNDAERWNRTLLDFLQLSRFQVPLPKKGMSLERFLRLSGAKTGEELTRERE